MKNLRGKTAILTGASGGIGKYIAHSLADQGMNLVLVAFPGLGLDELRIELQAKGIKVVAIALDLREPTQRSETIHAAIDAFGGIDVLVNNAGVELSSVYHELPTSQLSDILKVNLEAPMFLTHAIIPEMLKRGGGHVVNISSLAGKSGPGYQEPYAATKAGLVAFTFSLRATYAGKGIGASVVCPGFVEAGIYTRIKAETGFRAPVLLGSSRPEAVAKAVVRSIHNNLPEVIVNPYPVRPLFALTALFPRIGERLTTMLGAHTFFKQVAAKHQQGSKQISSDSQQKS